MDIFKEWQKINQDKFSTQTIKKEEIMQAISKESSLTINELKKRLKYKIFWIVFFIALFIVWFISSLSHPSVLPFIGIVITCYVVGFVLLFNQYKKMDEQIDPDMNILDTMKNAGSIKKALKYENYFGLFGFPVILICGAMVPKLSKGLTMLEVFSDVKFVLIILGCLAVLVPLMQILAKKMNDSAYGIYLKNLNENIRKMEELV